VLPGTCIGLAYEDTRQNFKELTARGQSLMEKAVEALVGEYLEDYEILRLQQVRPQFEDLILDNESQSAVLLNTLTFDRFETLRYKVGDATG